MERKKSFSSDRQSVSFLEHTGSFGQKSNNFARRKNKTVLQSIKTFTEFFFFTPLHSVTWKMKRSFWAKPKSAYDFPQTGLNFTMLPLGSFKARLQVCACPVCAHLTILNNVVIYLLTLKANRYYLQRPNRNSTGRIKIVDSKALDLVLCVLPSHPSVRVDESLAFPPGCSCRGGCSKKTDKIALFVARCKSPLAVPLRA